MIGVDLHDADITADLSSKTGRHQLVDEVRAATGGRLDGVIACAGISSGDTVTVSINYFGAVATLEGLRPFLAEADQPRAATISSIALLQSIDDDIVDACLRDDEPAARGRRRRQGRVRVPVDEAGIGPLGPPHRADGSRGRVPASRSTRSHRAWS